MGSFIQAGTIQKPLTETNTGDVGVYSAVSVIKGKVLKLGAKNTVFMRGQALYPVYFSSSCKWLLNKAMQATDNKVLDGYFLVYPRIKCRKFSEIIAEVNRSEDTKKILAELTDFLIRGLPTRGSAY